MSADVASYHGGDGGGEDPHDPSRIPTTCEDDSDTRTKGRGPSIREQLEKRRREAKEPLPLEYCPISQKIVGVEHAAFPRVLSDYIGAFCPTHYKNWKAVPQQFKDQVLARARFYYKIDENPDAEQILSCLDTECANRYRTKKTSRHVHFKRFYTKPEDYEEALKHHPIDMTPEQWRQQCEFFTSPAFLARSEQNRINRGNMKYVTTQGTKSLAQRRHELEKPDYVSTWMEVHLKKDKQFVNEYARQDYERLQAIQAARSQIDTDSGSSPDQVSIFEEAFGQRRGHVRGIGRRVKGKSSSSRAQSTQSQPPSQDWVNDMSVMFNLFSSQMDPSNMDPAKLAMFNMLKSKYSTPAPQPSQTHMDQGSPAHSQHSAASSDMHTSSTSQPQHLVPPLSQPLPQPSHPPPPYPYMYGPPYPFMYGGISQQHPSAFFPGSTNMAGSSQQPSSSQQAQPVYPYQWMMGASTSQPLQPPHTSQPVQPPQTSQPLQQPQTSQRQPSSLPEFDENERSHDFLSQL